MGPLDGLHVFKKHVHVLYITEVQSLRIAIGVLLICMCV